MKYETEEWQGHRLLVLRKSQNDLYPFKLGLGKCEVAVANLETIKAFIADETGTQKPKPVEVQEEIKIETIDDTPEESEVEDDF